MIYFYQIILVYYLVFLISLDNRTAITKDTKNIMYFVYGPDKISEKQIQDHLNDIKHYISSAFPDLKVNSIDIF